MHRRSAPSRCPGPMTTPAQRVETASRRPARRPLTSSALDAGRSTSPPGSTCRGPRPSLRPFSPRSGAATPGTGCPTPPSRHGSARLRAPGPFADSCRGRPDRGRSAPRLDRAARAWGRLQQADVRDAPRRRPRLRPRVVPWPIRRTGGRAASLAYSRPRHHRRAGSRHHRRADSCGGDDARRRCPGSDRTAGRARPARSCRCRTRG